MEKYKLVKSESQKDGTYYRILTEKEANKIAPYHHGTGVGGSITIIADVTNDVATILKANEPAACEWCDKILRKDAVTQEFLTGVFGYKYCSEQCMHEHIGSK